MIKRLLLIFALLASPILAQAQGQVNANFKWLAGTLLSSAYLDTTNHGFNVTCVSGCTGGGGGGSVTQGTSPWIVAGPTASGSSILDNPILIGGSDFGGTPKVFNWKVDSSGIGWVAINNVPHFILDSGTLTGITNPIHAIVDSGTITAVTSITNALPSGSNVIGHVIADSGSTTAVTGNVTVIQGTGTNLHAVLDSTSTTTVTQGTASNLNAAVVGTGTAGSAASGVVTVQGIASMTKLLVTPDSVALPANQSVNAAQINGHTTVEGGANGVLAIGGNVANAGTATANPVPVGGVFTTTPTTLSTGQTATLQFTAAQNAKQDLTTIAGTAPSTAGKLDVKGADGDVFVRQATASNLNATVTGSGTAGSAASGVVTVQGIASMTKLLVTPDSVALPNNQSVNLSQVNAHTTIEGGANGVLAVGGNVANAGTATANPVPVGGVFTTTPTTLTTGQTATLQFTNAQNAKTDLSTIAGTAAVNGSGTATGALRVEVANNGTGVIGLNTGTNSIGDVRSITTSVTPGTGAANLGKAEDAASADADTGVAAYGIRKTTAGTCADTAGTDGDYEPPCLVTGRLSIDVGGIAGATAVSGSGNATGALRVEIANNGTGVVGLNTGSNTVGKVDILGNGGASLDSAEDTASSGGDQVLHTGCVSNDADGTPFQSNGTDGDYAIMACDRDGAIMVTGQHPEQWTYHEDSSNALTTTTVHASCGTGEYNYITSVVFSTGAATAASIKILDSTTTTILGPWYLEAVNGRGLSVTFPTPKKQTSSATLISVTTTGAIAHGLDIQGFCAR